MTRTSYFQEKGTGDGDGGGIIFPHHPSTSSAHPGTTYPVRANPSLRSNASFRNKHTSNISKNKLIQQEMPNNSSKIEMSKDNLSAVEIECLFKHM